MITKSIAQILTQDGQIRGAGFLVSRTQILTTYHLIMNLMSKQATVDFPFVAPGDFQTAP